MYEQLATTCTYTPTILLVDNEESIHISLRHLLSDQPYNVLLADSGAHALDIMAARPIDLIMTDARMPPTGGAMLLAEAYRLHPATTRILLIGHSDMSVMVKAVNEGHVYRLTCKPWNDEEMLLILRQCMEFRHSQREHLLREQFTREQNDRLKAINATLEKRLVARTSELQQTADMLDLASEELNRSYVTGTEFFSRLTSLRLPEGIRVNSQLIELIRVYCKFQPMDEASARDLIIAAALYSIGKLSWSDRMIMLPSDLLRGSDRELYRAYPVHSESLLISLKPFKDAARLIRHHQERWDGTGFPDHLMADAIPVGSRVLKVAVDFIELQCGLILERKMSSDEALLYIRKYAGYLYDPEIVGTFIPACAAFLTDVTADHPAMNVVTTCVLAEGMVLARNLNANNGMLLLKAGKVLTSSMICKLTAFEAMEGAKYSVFIAEQDVGAHQPDSAQSLVE